jgi:hypothetical protein
MFPGSDLCTSVEEVVCFGLDERPAVQFWLAGSVATGARREQTRMVLFGFDSELTVSPLVAGKVPRRGFSNFKLEYKDKCDNLPKDGRQLL